MRPERDPEHLDPPVDTRPAHPHRAATPRSRPPDARPPRSRSGRRCSRPRTSARTAAAPESSTFSPHPHRHPRPAGRSHDPPATPSDPTESPSPSLTLATTPDGRPPASRHSPKRSTLFYWAMQTPRFGSAPAPESRRRVCCLKCKLAPMQALCTPNNRETAPQPQPPSPEPTLPRVTLLIQVKKDTPARCADGRTRRPAGHPRLPAWARPTSQPARTCPPRHHPAESVPRGPRAQIADPRPRRCAPRRFGLPRDNRRR